uniref:Uncharacterized protein n=1 Tax=Eutreptiella gymnastica TaxID=73025 RepID=A0A7S4LHW0_9EUGL
MNTFCGKRVAAHAGLQHSDWDTHCQCDPHRFHCCCCCLAACSQPQTLQTLQVHVSLGALSGGTGPLAPLHLSPCSLSMWLPTTHCTTNLCITLDLCEETVGCAQPTFVLHYCSYVVCTHTCRTVTLRHTVGQIPSA